MKIFIIILAVAAVSGVIFLFTRKPATTTTTQQTANTGLTGFLSSVNLSGLSLGNLLGKKEKPAACDPNRLGYDINGFPSAECGFGG